MFTIDKTELRRLFRKVNETTIEHPVVSGMRPELSDRMIAVMSAKTMSDIAHIKTEEIVELFAYIEEFASVLNYRDCFTGSFGDFYSNLQEIPSARKRRLL